MDRDIPDMDAVVVLLDALGVKGIWKSKDPKEVLSKWRDLKIAFESRCEFLSLELNKRQIDDRVSFTAFSDTIIITLPIQKRNVGKDLGRNEASLVIDTAGELLLPLFRVGTSTLKRKIRYFMEIIYAIRTDSISL